MTSVAEEVHHRIEQEIAETYRNLEYIVYVDPKPQELPPFLQSFRPEIVAIKRGEGGEIQEGVVVFVKTRTPQSVTLQQLEDLIRVVQSQPGWRFEIATRSSRETALLNALLPVLSLDKIKRQIKLAQALAQQEGAESAFLLLWIAVEALLRHQSRLDDVEIKQEGTLPLLSLLYTDGSLEEEDYYQLRNLFSLRNKIAHGFEAEELSSGAIERLASIANNLITQLSNAA